MENHYYIKEAIIMDIAMKVAKIRFKVHSELCSVVNAANQIGIISDEKANEMNRKNFHACCDALERLGFDVQGAFSGKEES